ncbi:MAG: NfeD family protein [Alphaproteobacteria bacterium]|nr:NfeD family protein [Alphaproteobacteria bacterium]
MDQIEVEFWYWLAFGVVLVALEALIPGTVLMWFGISAGVVGLVVFMAPDLAFTYQILIFGVLSVVSVVATRIWLRRQPIQTEDPDLNLRGQRYVGQVVVLAEPIESGVGKAKVGDSLWRVTGPDAPAGSRMRVTGSDSATLIVEPAD